MGYYTDRQRHRHTDTQTYRHTDKQTHRHTDTQTLSQFVVARGQSLRVVTGGRHYHSLLWPEVKVSELLLTADIITVCCGQRSKSQSCYWRQTLSQFVVARGQSLRVVTGGRHYHSLLWPEIKVSELLVA